MGQVHLDTQRGEFGWWALWAPLAVLVVVVLVAHFFPQLREIFFGNILPAAVIFAHAVGL